MIDNMLKYLEHIMSGFLHKLWVEGYLIGGGGCIVLA